jgi:hypothetical protein
MRGQENMLRMRMAGYKPAGMVFVCDYPVPSDLIDWRYKEDQRNPLVCIAGDQIHLLDFRFLVGLHVSVSGDDAERIRTAAMAIKKAGARFVIAAGGGVGYLWKLGDTEWLKF